MRIRIHHLTRYDYDTPARALVQLLRLTPRGHDAQHVVHWRIDIDADGHLREGVDGFGNVIHRLSVDRPTERLSILVTGEVDTQDSAGVLRGSHEPLPPELFLRDTALTRAGPALASFLQDGLGAGEPLARCHALLAAIHAHMLFDTRATDATTPADDAFALGRGVCQDLAHIFIAGARFAGLPARYVSGHLARSDRQDQEAAHAWAEAHLPGLGWVAFDPANGVCATDAYVRVAVGLDYLDAAPVRGARTGGGAEALTVELRVAGAMRQSQS